MTFIDNDSEKPTTLQVVIFSLLAFTFLLSAIHAFFRTSTRRHYHRLYSVRFLFPLACINCFLENIALAASGPIIEHQQDDHPLLKIVFVLQAAQIPIYLVTIFELTYLVHKRRSVHFCGMFFDEGRLGRRIQGVFGTPVKSFIFRNLIRFIALLCLITGVCANLDLLRDSQAQDELAGRTGWWKLWDGNDSDNDNDNDAVYSVHVLMSLIPTVILIFCSFFLSIALWRYGSNSSMVVHSSCANPWFYPMFGTIALSIGQLFYERWYPVTSNLGLLVYTLTLLVLMREIDKDSTKTAEFTDFLKQVVLTGNAISMQNDNVDFSIEKIGDANQRVWEEEEIV